MELSVLLPSGHLSAPETPRSGRLVALEGIARRRRRQDVQFVFPQRISLERLCEMTEDCFRKPSGGQRPMAVCVALMGVMAGSADVRAHSPRKKVRRMSMGSTPESSRIRPATANPDGRLSAYLEVERLPSISVNANDEAAVIQPPGLPGTRRLRALSKEKNEPLVDCMAEFVR